MPVFEQGYRRYVGPVSTKPRAFAIAWENVRPRMRWWVWLLMFLLLILPFSGLVFIVLIRANFVSSPIPTAGTPHRFVAFETPQTHVALLESFRASALGFYWNVLDTFSTPPFCQSVVVPAVACAGLFAADRRTGALQIYFARPVSRLDYLMGKLMAGSFFVALTTVLPAILLWILDISFGTVASFTWQTWVAPLAIVGGSACYALWTLGLILSLSSVMRRPAFVAITVIFVNYVAEALGNILSRTFHDPAWSILQPHRAVGTVTSALFDVDLPSWANVPTAFGIAVGLPLALLAFTWWRVRAVEVST
jgi:ABC-type transport system involved in multi-copper enzyme maturation permease subunit